MIVCEQLFGVLGQAVAAIAEGWVVVMVPDAGVETDAADDLPGVEPSHLGVAVQLIEIADPQRKIAVGKQLDRFGLGKAHQQRLDLLLARAFPEQRREVLCGGIQPGGAVGGDDNPGGIEVVMQGLGFPEEFRAEQDVAAAGLLADSGGIPDRDGRLDDDERPGVDPDDLSDDRFDGRGVKGIPAAVVVGGGGDDDKFRLAVCGIAVQRRGQIQLLFSEKLFDTGVPDGGLAAVDAIHLFGEDVHRQDMVMLRQKGRDGQPDIAGPCDCDFSVHAETLLDILTSRGPAARGWYHSW